MKSPKKELRYELRLTAQDKVTAQRIAKKRGYPSPASLVLRILEEERQRLFGDEPEDSAANSAFSEGKKDAKRKQ